MKRNPVGWFEIYVRDMDRAKKFYETVLQTSLTKLEAPDPNLEMWSFPMVEDAPGCPGALTKMKGIEPGGMGALIYFSCKNCADEASRVEKAGGAVQQPKMSIGQYGYIALVKDTEGNMIGLHSLE